MKIKGVEFNVNAASGALGWSGEGYWYHKIYGFIFPSFKKTMADLNFVTKTITWEKNEGNLPLDENFAPKELFPKCIKVYPIQGMMLNAVNLSGPGFVPLLATGKLQNVKRDALGISFMPIGETISDMLWETRNFRDKLIEVLSKGSYHFNEGFQPTTKIWVQVNQSCPNTVRSDGQILAYMRDILEMLQPLRKNYGIVLDLKVNYLVENKVIAKICEDDLCDIVTISNTIKFGTKDAGIPWKRLFWWRRTSPLEKYGGGGISGRPEFDPVCNKILSLHISKPIKASGGIFSVSNVRLLKAYGACSIEFATVSMLRPWRVSRIVEEARRIF